jgi:hypothetical protein
MLTESEFVDAATTRVLGAQSPTPSEDVLP